MNKLKDLLEQKKVLISDGAWGTMLQQKGLMPGECPELWNLNQPDKVYEVAASYIASGADIIETNSFGGNRIKLKSYGLENNCYKINKAAAEISRKAAGDEKLVFGSIGPTGKFLITGETSLDELYEVYKEQSMALVDGGADAIVLETFTALDELKIALKAAKENTECEVICTMTFDKLADGSFKTMMGVSPKNMVNELNELQPDVIGSNCGNGFENMILITEEIRATGTTIPILIHANAGMPILDKNNNTIFPESPEHMSNRFQDLILAGANIVGGCCGTTPEHIVKLVNTKNNI